MPRLATRTNDFLTFQVMELFKQAQALQAAGKDLEGGLADIGKRTGAAPKPAKRSRKKEAEREETPHRLHLIGLREIGRAHV